ncbi:S-layer homology domain-containing protein [Paenibacillus validus]|uniref:S-layer homology domain-containing protein n=1 Tax=Paenibacillus validus TaxID=44253 RepID=UPI003D2BFD5E
MREMSYNLSKENSQQPKDIRGGEKKVMKKSLSAILSLAMAFSMFSSVAFGAEAEAKKTSADFDDLKDLTAEQKVIFDAMISGGIFDGVGEKTFGLKDKMNRAQFAKVAALIFDLEVDTSLKTSSFSDVKAEDPANGYALPYIEALKAAGLTDGYAPGEYNPAGEVTKQELATFLVRGLGWEAEAKASAGVSDKTVSDWAKGYVAVAIEKKILTSGEDGTFGGTSAATRDLLVLSSYAADKQYVPAGKVSVTEAKATGVRQVTVNFNKPVDTDKAQVTLKKGSLAIATTTKFSEDKKSAILTLDDVKITAGSYSVAVTGLDAATIDKSTAEFTAEDEKLTKLSFVNPSEKIAKSPSVIVKVKAENQYGENASINGGSYTAMAGGETKTVKRNDDTGFLEIELDTTRNSAGTPTTSELDVVPINIYLTNSNISAQKTFKIGTEPMVSKIELGAPVYSTGSTTLNGEGEYVELPITRYDQYGDVFKDNDKFTGAFASLSDRTKADVIITPWNDEALKFDATTAKKDKLKISLSKNIDKAGEYTATVYVSGSSATATISVKSTKLATSVDFGSFNGVLATGDVNKYIPIVAYDANGDQLSADDIVDNAKNKRFTISVSGANIATAPLGNGNDAIVTSGEHKGKIKLDSITAGKGGVVYVNLGIYTANVQVNKYQQYTVQDQRVADTIKLVSAEPAHKATNGGASKVKWQVLDQYGEKLDALGSNAANYKLAVSVSNATYGSVSGPVADGVDIPSTNFKAFNGKEIKLTGQNVTNAAQKVKLEVKLLENKTGFTDATKTVTLKTVDNEVEVLPSTTELNYRIEPVKDLFAVLDSGMTNNFKDTDAGKFYNALGRTISIKAKDKSGNEVAIPENLITAVTSSNTSVAHAVYNNGFGFKFDENGKAVPDVSNVADAGKAAIVGNKAGTATITIAYTNLKGEQKTEVVNVNVKTDPVSVASLTAGNSSYDAAKTGNTLNDNAYAIMDLKVIDNYGIEYTKEEIFNFRQFTNVLYTVSDVHGGGTVTVAGDGTITLNGNVTDFVLKATSGTKSVTTDVRVTP